jgi:hypothetical protein
MNAKALAQHFEWFCREEQITVGAHSSGGRANRKRRSVKVRPIKSAISYAVAMHELGHILGSRQSGTRLDQEVGAWEWAHDNAVEWTDAMEAKMQKCLRSYLDWSKRRKGARQADANHPIHALIG